MKVFSAFLTLICVVVLAIAIGRRIPPDTAAMAVGVVLGALAAIPVSLFMGLLVSRREPSAPALDEEPMRPFAQQPAYQPLDGYAPRRDYPPLVIINPAAFQSSGRASYPAARVDNMPMLGGPRQFRVIGEEAT